MAVEIFKPDQWREFFLMTGSGTAALAGLVFVAMTLNLDVIVKDPTHRYRAIGTLSGFTAAFMICAFALMGGQNHVAVGIEWLIVSFVAGVIYVNGYIQSGKKGGSERARILSRVVGGTVCYITEVVGSLLLIFGYIAGLYIAAVAMIIYFAFLVSGAWLLVVRVHEDAITRKSK
jgi:hypothetical protein